ncbi:MAG: LacI family DNA-binding transcriptional regulator [Fusobacterium sp.]|nr:LacI family DNA-binding transcriptional regulator [Fusobacterium sp.]
MEKKLTILEIAEMADVGKSTVSRFLNGGYVSQKNREKLEKIVKKYNYKPNVFARGIKAKNNRFIGIIVPCLDSFVTSQILMQLDNSLRKNGYVPLIINTDHNFDLELQGLDDLIRLNVEGIIFFSTIITEKHKQFFNKTTTPFLVIGQKFDGVPYIVNDDFLAGKKIGEYVAKLGHKKILYLGVSESDEAVGIIRKNGIMEGLKKYKDIEINYLETDFSTEKSEKIIDKYLKNQKPSCIICATDNIAFGVLKAIRKNNLVVPKDISICGFGGYKISSILTPALTTIRFKYKKIGNLASETIINIINKNEIIEKQYVDFDFIKGETIKNLK